MEITEADSAEKYKLFVHILFYFAPVTMLLLSNKMSWEKLLNSRTCASLLLVSGVGGVQRPVAALRGASASQ